MLSRRGPAGPGRSLLVGVCERLALTARGFWAVVVAVGLVFLAAAGSYVFVFPTPTGGPAMVAAAAAAAIGVPLLVAGTLGLTAARGQPLATDRRR